MYLTEEKTLLKNLSKLAVFSENATGASISYQVDMDHQQKTNNAWTPIDDIEKNIRDVLSLNAKGFSRIRFRITGSGAKTPVIFRGFEGLDVTTNKPE